MNRVAPSRKQSRRPQRIPATSHGLRLQLDRTEGAAPLYRQIRDGVRASVVAGTLAAGMRLPPERELASALGVNRTTIMRAYQELAADGMVEAHPGRGTIICGQTAAEESPVATAWSHAAVADTSWLLGLPAFGAGNLGPDPGLLRDMAALSTRDDMISFALGAPGHDLVPADALHQAMNTALGRAGAVGLGYGPVEGLEALRLEIGERMSRRRVAADPTDIIVLAGGTQGIALIARALMEPGDEVVVESPTYIGLIQTLGAAGARLIGVPIDGEGIRVDLLEPILARRKVRLICVQPTFHNPTGVTLSAARRERLMSLARRYAVPILEDDAYGDLCHIAPGPQPLKALDRSGLVIYLSTFSKTLAPGLRVGWIVAPPPVIARLALAKQFMDLNTGTLSQLTLIEFLRSGTYDDHLTFVRAVYAERRQGMLAALSEASAYLTVLPQPAMPTAPTGGFFLWCRLKAGRHSRVLAAAASRAGVALLGGEAFYPPAMLHGDNGQDCLRLCFASNSLAVNREGIHRLIPLLERLPDPSSSQTPTPGQGLRPVV